MKIIHKLLAFLSRPCRECGGSGFVVDRDVASFIERNGLAAFQAADTLMRNEIEYGHLGSIPIGTWEEVGLSEDEAELFATDTGHCHILHSCRVCGGQKDHEGALDMATAIINRLKRNDRKRYAEWRAKQGPDDLKERRRRRMVIAVQHAESRREMEQDGPCVYAAELAEWDADASENGVGGSARDGRKPLEC